jgi:hypothetical protein
MKTYQIKNRWNGKVIAKCKAKTLKDAVMALVADGTDLSDANLSDANLYGIKLKGAKLIDSCLYNVNFGKAELDDVNIKGAYLYAANFRGAKLNNIDFRGVDLSDIDFSGAKLSNINYSGVKVPVVKNLHKKILEQIKTGKGSLEMNTWHTCETTHCRAGWAIHLAGKKGYALAMVATSELAGALIHLVSCPFLERAPNFYATNEDALADIEACAEKESRLI